MRRLLYPCPTRTTTFELQTQQKNEDRHVEAGAGGIVSSSGGAKGEASSRGRSYHSFFSQFSSRSRPGIVEGALEVQYSRDLPDAFRSVRGERDVRV